MSQPSSKAAPGGGRLFNTGKGPTLQPVDIGHRDYMAVVDPDTAFWALVRKETPMRKRPGSSPRR
jgi:uncharacterized protein